MIADTDIDAVQINKALTRVILGGFIEGTCLTNPQPERYDGYTAKLEVLAYLGSRGSGNLPQTLGRLIDGDQKYIQEIYARIFSENKNIPPEEFLLYFSQGMMKEDSSRFELAKAMDNQQTIARIEDF